MTGRARGGGGGLSKDLAKSCRKGSSVKAAGLERMVFTSCSSRVLSPPPRMNLEMKSVARRVGSPRGTPRRMKSLVFKLEEKLTRRQARLSTRDLKSPMATASVHSKRMREGG